MGQLVYLSDFCTNLLSSFIAYENGNISVKIQIFELFATSLMKSLLTDKTIFYVN